MYLENNIKLITKNELNWIGEPNLSMEFPKFLYKDNNTEYFECEEKNIFSLSNLKDSSFRHSSLKKQLIFIIGTYSIEELKEVIKHKHKDTLVIVIETEFNLFSRALHEKDLSVFKDHNILLFCDKLSNLDDFLNSILYYMKYVEVLKNSTYYITEFYREVNIKKTIEILKVIRENVRNKILTLGNDIEDSLIGLKQNLDNLKFFPKAKNVSSLKNAYTGVPAIIVAAGPSLNKNIQELKKVNGKAIIIAVDTILEKLLNENIKVDFVCTIERVDKVYDYFYKDKSLPEEVTLISPPLLDSRILEEYKGNVLLPFRMGVREYLWMRQIVDANENDFIEMGSSCAHVALGFAQHINASPIILVGQDLAYDQVTGNTHVSGTTYDTLDNKEVNETILSTDAYTLGYYGEEVKTTHSWLMFKSWIESMISRYQLQVINATEGGANIKGTQQMSLKEVIDNYCNRLEVSVFDKINTTPNNSIDIEKIVLNLKDEQILLNYLKEKCFYYTEKLQNLEINASNLNKKRFIKESNILFKEIDIIIEAASNALIVMHNIQPSFVKFYWDLNDLEQTLNEFNMHEKKGIYIKLLVVINFTVQSINQLIEGALQDIN